MDRHVEFLPLVDQIFGGQSLVGERHVHHRGRVSFSRRQIDQAPLAQHEDAPAIESIFLHEVADDPRRPVRDRRQPLQIDLDVEVTGVRDDGAVLHGTEVLLADDAGVAGHRDKHITHLGGLSHRHHFEAVHHGLQRLERLYLGDDHPGPGAAGPGGDPASAPTVAGHHHAASGQQDVGGAQDAVQRRLARTIAVVEQVLGEAVVHRDHRKLQHLVVGHGPQADDARRRLLGRADHRLDQAASLLGRQRGRPAPYRLGQVIEALERDHVERADEVRAIIHRERRSVSQGGADVFVVDVVLFALDGEDLDAVVPDQMCGDVVLRGKRIGGAERDVGAARLQRHGQIGGLGGDMKASRELLALQRPLLGKALANQPQDGHRPLRPFDSKLPLVRQLDVVDVVVGRLYRHDLPCPSLNRVAISGRSPGHRAPMRTRHLDRARDRSARKRPSA